jgi:class 3 adenylate cyclase
MNTWRIPAFWSAGISALIGAAVALAACQTAFRSFEYFAADARLSHRTVQAKPRNDLVVIAIDDAALADSPFESPINRGLLASIVEQLDRKGARAIALDVVLDRPSFPEDDARLSAAIAGAHASVILGRDPGAAAGIAACDTAQPKGGASASAARSILPVFAEHAQLADLLICLDGDGVARNLPSDPAASGIVSAIAARLGVNARADARPIVFATAPGDVPSPPIYSAAMLEHLPPTWFEGRVVLVGLITPYSPDWYETPLRFSPVHTPIQPAERMPKGKLPGVMIHALGAATLVDGARGPSAGWLTNAVLALVGGVAGAVLASIPAAWWVRTLAAFGLVAAMLGLAILAGPFGAIMLPVTPFPLALALAGGLTAGAEARRVIAQRRMVRQAFERYLAPSVVDELVRAPSLVALGATEREISVLFTDLEGFTKFVDGNPPALVAEILNGYLDAIIAQVVAHGGAVDKIVGDAVHAMFSAPIADAEHRSHACACAMAVDAASETYRARIREQHGVSLGVTRIAAHSGKAMVGNFGGQRRLDYTAHGSTINAVARLEAANKVFGTRICISEACRTPLADVCWRPIGDVRLRGIADPMRVYQALPGGCASAEAAEAYAEAYAAIARDPQDAERRFRTLAAEHPDDPLVAFQLRRIASGDPAAVLEV